jgi:hypothetical protein
MIFNGTGIFEPVPQLGKIPHDSIQVGSRIIITIRVEYSYTQSYTPVPTWESPGIATWRKRASHNQKELILRIMWSIQVIFCSIAITMKCLPHSCTYPYMARETAGIYRNCGMERDSLTPMIFSGHTYHVPILRQCLLDCMAYTQYCTYGNGATRKMLIDPTHVDDTSNGGVISEANFPLR